VSTPSRNWDIRVDHTPGVEGLKISGIVTVPTPAHEATLVVSSSQGATLTLDIIVQAGNGLAATVLTDKLLDYFEPGPMKYNTVSIRHEGEMVVTVTDFLMQPKP